MATIDDKDPFGAAPFHPLNHNRRIRNQQIGDHIQLRIDQPSSSATDQQSSSNILQGNFLNKKRLMQQLQPKPVQHRRQRSFVISLVINDLDHRLLIGTKPIRSDQQVICDNACKL
jgi:hypothetical protein